MRETHIYCMLCVLKEMIPIPGAVSISEPFLIYSPPTSFVVLRGAGITTLFIQSSSESFKDFVLYILIDETFPVTIIYAFLGKQTLNSIFLTYYIFSCSLFLGQSVSVSSVHSFLLHPITA